MSKAAAIAVALLFAAAARAEDTPPVRDPMRPFGAVAAAGAAVAAGAPRFALTAVLIAPTRRVAIVNGKSYAQGATVDGAEIVAIEHELVRLREHGAELVIHLGRPSDGRPQRVQGETVP